MIQQIRTLVGALMSSLVLLGLVLAFALPAEDRFAAPPLWLVAAQVVAGGVVFALLESVGYRTAAIDPGVDRESAMTASGRAFQSGTIVRFALSEPIALASFAAVFVIDGGSVPGYATGAAISLALIGYHAWPWSRPIDKTIASLERAGGNSYLREKLELPPRMGGAIQEL
jgi:hypothetical protein